MDLDAYQPLSLGHLRQWLGQLSVSSDDRVNKLANCDQFIG